MADFEDIFDEEVLDPQQILPGRKENDDWENFSTDFNQTVKIFEVTVEEDGKNMNVYAQGNMELHKPAIYKGEVHGEPIQIQENGGYLMISIPTNIQHQTSNYILKMYQMMDGEEVLYQGKPNRILLVQVPVPLKRNGIMDISFRFNIMFTC